MSENTVDFIDDEALNALLEIPPASADEVRSIIAKGLDKQPLSVEETATLLRTTDPALVGEIFDAARQLKDNVYGNRVVLFAPLYIGNYCTNDCAYCAFARSNKGVERRTLSDEDIRAQVRALENKGHKRLILVYGEHPNYDADYIARTVKECYDVKDGHGEIRRVNINAAPLDVEGFRKVHESGIGTYQIFMETYHHETYHKVHPDGTGKGDYLWRLDALDRAFEAGCDDVGIGALFGLYDWRFEVLALVKHALHLQERFGCGPHTISFPRLRPAHGVDLSDDYLVSDDEFRRLVAILRLAVPYTGLILTARETPEIRRELMSFGVSQIDAGSRIEMGGYTEAGDTQTQVAEREQFELGDIRPLNEVMRDLLANGYVPSFCTACYRLGRTGEHFMEFAVPGFIKRYCTPNALTTLVEYLVDYADEETYNVGMERVAEELDALPDNAVKEDLIRRIEDIKSGKERDSYI